MNARQPGVRPGFRPRRPSRAKGLDAENFLQQLRPCRCGPKAPHDHDDAWTRAVPSALFDRYREAYRRSCPRPYPGWPDRRRPQAALSHGGGTIAYQRDKARILHSAAFRGLQAKTQVMGLEKVIFSGHA